MRRNSPKLIDKLIERYNIKLSEDGSFSLKEEGVVALLSHLRDPVPLAKQFIYKGAALWEK
jgi:hypothetical protein